MKYTLALLSLFIIACSQPHPKTTVVIPEKPIDTSKYAILKFDAIRDSSYFETGSKPAQLSAGEIDTIENIIAKKVIDYNKAERAFDDSLDKKNHPKLPANAVPFYNVIYYPENYYKQFVAVVNAKGQKEVYVNCFCEDFYKESGNIKSYWRKEFVMVCDGGSCFFTIKINLTTNTVLLFGVNGVA